MSKTLTYILVAGVVIIGGYFVVNSPKSEEMTNGNEQVATNTVPEGKKIAFSEFVKKGGSYQCEVKQAMSDVENSGTVYISGENIRGEYDTVAEGRAMHTSFIMKDGFSYMWSNMMPNNMGYKIKVEKKEGDTGAAASGTYAWNAEQIGDYNCEVWVVDQSKFALPAGVDFQELKY